METNFTEMDRIVTVMKFYSATRTWVPFEFIAVHVAQAATSLIRTLDEMRDLGMVELRESTPNDRRTAHYRLHSERPRKVADSSLFGHGKLAEKKRVSISDVATHVFLQQRAHPACVETIARYAADMEKSCAFPPIEVYRTPDDKLVLVDGYHRLCAAKLVGERRIDALVSDGTFAEAVGRACSANTNRGLRRTRRDNRRSLIAFFMNPRYDGATPGQAGTVIGCSSEHARHVRNELQNMRFIPGPGGASPVVFSTAEIQYIHDLARRENRKEIDHAG